MNTDKLNAYCTSYNSTMYTFLSAYIYLFNCAHTRTQNGVLLPSVAGKTFKTLSGSGFSFADGHTGAHARD